MGSCVSIHKSCGSALELQMSSLVLEDKLSIPSTPVKEKPPSIVELRYKSQSSPRNSVASYRSYGSKEEAFYDTQAWLDSDCDDDFYSMNGDFTPSRGNTPVHSAIENLRFSKILSPQVNRVLFDGRPPRRSVSNRSQGSTPLHRSSSAMSPLAKGALPEVARGSTPDSSSIPKKKKLADLFRESIRERAGEGLAFTGYENESSPNAAILSPELANETPYVSRTNFVPSNGKRTPIGDCLPEKDKQVKAAQCCFPRLVSSRSLRENKRASSPSISLDGL